jgi:hypothetical protein
MAYFYKALFESFSTEGPLNTQFESYVNIQYAKMHLVFTCYKIQSSCNVTERRHVFLFIIL